MPIARALENNRDLRVAVLNVERARALYRVQRSERLPSVAGNVQATRTGGDGPNTEIYSASVGVAGFELDLFGRVRSLSEAALREYFATEEARRAAQLSLVAEVANAWLTLAADRELLEVSQATLKTQEDSFKLTQRRHEATDIDVNAMHLCRIGRHAVVEFDLLLFRQLFPRPHGGVTR